MHTAKASLVGSEHFSQIWRTAQKALNLTLSSCQVFQRSQMWCGTGRAWRLKPLQNLASGPLKCHVAKRLFTSKSQLQPPAPTYPTLLGRVSGKSAPEPVSSQTPVSDVLQRPFSNSRPGLQTPFCIEALGSAIGFARLHMHRSPAAPAEFKVPKPRRWTGFSSSLSDSFAQKSWIHSGHVPVLMLCSLWNLSCLVLSAAACVATNALAMWRWAWRSRRADLSLNHGESSICPCVARVGLVSGRALACLLPFGSSAAVRLEPLQRFRLRALTCHISSQSLAGCESRSCLRLASHLWSRRLMFRRARQRQSSLWRVPQHTPLLRKLRKLCFLDLLSTNGASKPKLVQTASCMISILKSQIHGLDLFKPLQRASSRSGPARSLRFAFSTRPSEFRRITSRSSPLQPVPLNTPIARQPRTSSCMCLSAATGLQQPWPPMKPLQPMQVRARFLGRSKFNAHAVLRCRNCSRVLFRRGFCRGLSLQGAIWCIPKSRWSMLTAKKTPQPKLLQTVASMIFKMRSSRSRRSKLFKPWQARNSICDCSVVLLPRAVGQHPSQIWRAISRSFSLQPAPFNTPIVGQLHSVSCRFLPATTGLRQQHLRSSACRHSNNIAVTKPEELEHLQSAQLCAFTFVCFANLVSLSARSIRLARGLLLESGYGYALPYQRAKCMGGPVVELFWLHPPILRDAWPQPQPRLAQSASASEVPTQESCLAPFYSKHSCRSWWTYRGTSLTVTERFSTSSKSSMISKTLNQQKLPVRGVETVGLAVWAHAVGAV